ncbi:MAG: MaoC/PaaZ C-terminal domain-containing protein [Jatrophihabitans sp.]|uniref:MaoC/PaaZ C-terminal domain-containing protein n=1 Tax=Jatrophihabitans sp. TaxID=1932789 RepID=UPI003F7ED50E
MTSRPAAVAPAAPAIPESGYLFPVESTHLHFFARAIGDRDADVVDHRVATAPPTFTAAHIQFMSANPLRPHGDDPWVGSGRTASGAPAAAFGAGLHAEQAYVYHRPVRAGQVVRVDHRQGRSWVKPRRQGGHLSFSEVLTDFRDTASDELLQSVSQVAVVLSPDPAPDGVTTDDGAAPPGPAATAGTGEHRDLVIADGLTRSRLVMYAGASGDYNPLHTDEVFATQAAGYPSVFAHGMWTMGASGRVLTVWFGVDALRTYRASFRGQVWPGETLTARATVVGERAGELVLELVTTTHEGRVVMTGGATVIAP